eukprot:TRINITY_DN34425_c0_g1_i1.p1 TRINITY_DN34425_c0_g1~~TRINITY_DN34425_c0_g1_i1.p1  ORF type:complete len:300 (-),score=56.45 TRINITY_DN34425_c0_g1_i1:9-908(-)
MINYPAIVLFGDSLTQYSFNPGGWGERLADRYQRRADVLKRGYAGYTSRWALPLLPKIFAKGDSRVVLAVVCFGGNDASLLEENPRQHVPIEEFEENLKRIVKYVRDACCNAHILLMSNGRMVEEKWTEFLKKRQGGKFSGNCDRTDVMHGEYAAASGRVAADMGCSFLNLHKAMLSESNWQALFSDGLHLSEAGHAFVATKVLQKVHENFPLIDVTCCRFSGSPANLRSSSPLVQHGAWHDNIDASGAGVLAVAPTAWLQSESFVNKSFVMATISALVAFTTGLILGMRCQTLSRFRH